MADTRRKKVIVFNKDDLRRSADDIRKEFENIKSSGRNSAKGVQEAFEGLGKKASTALNEAFDGNNFKGLKDIEESLKIQRKAVDDLTEQYKKAKAEFDSVNVGTQDGGLIAKREKASKLFNQVKAELEGETNLLKKQEEAFKLISTELQTAGDKSVTFYTQMRQIKEEMNSLSLAGQDQTPRYEELRSKLDEVSTAYRKVQQEQQMLAKYGNMVIPGLIQGMSGLSGAVSTYQGVIGLFVKDNQRLAEVQTKLQSAMALTIGLQQVQQTLHSTSAFRIGVVRKATQAWTTAQNALNTSLGISKGLAGAFMAGGIMALVAGVGYLITKYRDWSKEQERLKTIQREFNNVMLEGRKNAQKDIVSLDFLYKATQDQTKSQKERLKAAKELQRLYPDYLGNLSQEEILAGKGATAYEKQADAIIKVAKAQAAKDKIIENEKKRIELIDKLEEAQKKQVYAEKELKEALDNTGGYGALHGDGAGILGLTRKAKKAKDNTENIIKELDGLDKSNNKLKGSLNVDDWIDGGGKGNDDPAKETIVSLLDDIEKAKFQLSKQGVEDRIAILELEEQYELSSLDKRLENAKYSEEEKQNLILLVQKLYSLKREQITEEEQQKKQAEIEKSLEAYTSYEVQRNQIIEKYAKLRENAKGNKSIDVSLIDKGQDEALKKLDKEFGKSAEVLNTVLDLTRATTKQLVAELGNVREKLKNVNDTKEAESLQNRIETILGKLETRAPFMSFKENLKTATKDGKIDFELLGEAIDGLLPELNSIASDARTLFGDGVGDFMDDVNLAVDGFSSLAMSVGSFASGDIMGGISGAMSAAASLSQLFKSKSKEQKDTERIQAATERIGKTNEVINGLIEKRIDLIHKATAAEIKYNETLTQAAINTQKGFIENEFRRLGINDFFGKKGKNNNLKLQDLGITDMDKLSDFWDSEERLKLLQNGYDQRNKDEWQQIIDAYRALIDAEEQLAIAKKESLTGMSLEDAQNGLDDFIKDAEKGFNDVAKSFEDTMSNAMLNLIKKQYMNEALEAWYDDFAKAMDDDSLSDAEVEALRDQYYAIYEEGKKRLDSMREVIGGDSSMNQQSSVGVTKTASQDSIDVLDGRLTHVQETNQEISNNSTAILEQMRSNFAMLNEKMETSRNITLQSMYHLADIVNNTNVLPGMAKDIAEVKRNTKGL